MSDIPKTEQAAIVAGVGTIQLLSTQRGHRWIASKLRPAFSRCCSCGDWWPLAGDLAPMPVCPGERAGFVSPKDLPRGPNGLPFCSEACIHEHKIRTQPSYAKQQVAKRDDGICAICRVDTFAPLRPIKTYKGHYPGAVYSLFDMDHIVPVVEGGGACGLENLRTLCKPCHRKVTAELAARRAEARRKAKAVVA